MTREANVIIRVEMAYAYRAHLDEGAWSGFHLIYTFGIWVLLLVASVNHVVGLTENRRSFNVELSILFLLL